MKLSLFPTLKNYKKEYLPRDLFSGIIIAAVSIPISMGYAQIAGCRMSSKIDPLFYLLLTHLSDCYINC